MNKMFEVQEPFLQFEALHQSSTALQGKKVTI